MDLNGKHIFISKQQGIGDVVLTTPLIYALKKIYPLAHITFMVFANAVQAVQGLPFIDEVFVYDKKKDSVFKLWNKLRTADIALLLDLQYRPAMVACLAGVPLRVGVKHKRGNWLSRGGALPWEAWLDHTYEPVAQARIVKTLLQVDVDQADLMQPFFAEPSSQDFSMVNSLLQGHHWDLSRPFIVSSPITAYYLKNWPQERWEETIRTIYQKHGIPTVIIGTSPEQKAYEGEGVINLTGKTTLLQMAALIKHARLLLNSCSLPVHIAAAFDVPTVVLYGYSESKRWSPRKQCSMVCSRMECSPCDGYYGKPCPWEKPLCMEDISVNQVVEAVEQQLQQQK